MKKQKKEEKLEICIDAFSYRMRFMTFFSYYQHLI
jgi:hypothetical protein